MHRISIPASLFFILGISFNRISKQNQSIYHFPLPIGQGPRGSGDLVNSQFGRPSFRLPNAQGRPGEIDPYADDAVVIEAAGEDDGSSRTPVNGRFGRPSFRLPNAEGTGDEFDPFGDDGDDGVVIVGDDDDEDDYVVVGEDPPNSVVVNSE